MKSKAWLGLTAPIWIAVAMTSGSCGDDESPDPGNTSDRLNTGQPCTEDGQCIGAACLTNDTFTALLHEEANIEGGYCSGFNCQRNSPDPDLCGPGGYCYDLEPYLESPFTACLQTCTSQEDCRDGYVCTDGSGSGTYPPFDPMACLPPDLLCLLDVQEYCADAGVGGAGGSGAGGAGGA